MAENPVLYPEQIDISNCAKEPIHIIGKIQELGAILACDAETLEISQCSKNTLKLFGVAHENLLGNRLEVLLGSDREKDLRLLIKKRKAFLPFEVEINGTNFLMLPHLSSGHLIIDFEPLKEEHDPILFQRQLSKILNNLRSAETVKELCREAAALTAELFGYDRVMVYKFDEEWNGEVVAEEKQEEADSWLNLSYPASDIPEQARKLFLKHRVRIIADVNYAPVPIVPEISPVTNAPLNLSKSGLRAVSPIHIEYLQNMGVGASLTAGVIVDGKLWGLVACHHDTAKFINYYQRESCHFLTQMFSNELALRETNRFLEKTEVSGKLREELVLQMKREQDPVQALSTGETKFTDLIECGGGALLINGKLKLTGTTPSAEEVEGLISRFLKEQDENLYFSRRLSEVYPEAEKYQKEASGLLSLRIENNYLIWFRPEVVQTVNWGGNPGNKVTYNEEKKRLSPRKSFEKWSEELRGTSESWKDYDLEVVKALGENVSYRLLEKQRNEIEDLNKRLREAYNELELFSYGLSHDLRAPLRGIMGYLEIIREDYEEKLEVEGQTMLETTFDLTERMSTLIDDILSYSRLNSGEMEDEEFSVNGLIDEILQGFNTGVNYPSTKIKVQQDMAPMVGDRRMLYQLWSNLINNGLIYSSKIEQPQVEIGCKQKDDRNIWFVKDNGIGIAPEYKEKIFATFSRLNGNGFKGSGIGLAIVKRVVEKHGGKVWVESEPNRGATFYFYV